MKKLLNPLVIFSAAAVFLLFLPDSDTFAAQFSVAPHLLDHLVVIDEDRLNSLYWKLAVLLLAALSVITMTLWLRCARLKPLIAGTAVLIAYGWLRLQMNGMPLGMALRTPPLIGLYVMLMTVIVMCGLCRDMRVPFGLGLGFLAVGSVKLVYAVYCYRRYGGVQIFEGTSALAMDGALLIQWAVIAVGASLYGLHQIMQGKIQKGGLLFLVAMIFSAAVAASFRRTALVLVLGNLGAAVLIYFWLKRRLLVGLLWLGGLSLAASLGLFLVMASVFGFTTAYERVLSLSKSANSANAFSDSNEVYLDDQKALVDVLLASKFSGTGPGLPYGVSRLSDDFTNEGYIPLHIGSAEMWASFGVVGMAYHLLILFLLPVLCLRAYRKGLPDGEFVPFALVASYILLTAFWPFAPPFYFNIQTSLIFGMCFGYLVSASARVTVPSRFSKGQLVAPDRPLASLPA